MKPYHFSLESLRVLRQQKERAAQQRYAGALAVCHEAELQLQHATAELAAGWNLLGQELGHGTTANWLTSFRAWCKVLEIRWNERKAALDETRRTAEQLFQEMACAVRDREALDRFHDKSRHVHDCAVQREEQKMFDELAVQMNGAPGPLQFTGQNN
jgi:flagellar export protein FliJ